VVWSAVKRRSSVLLAVFAVGGVLPSAALAQTDAAPPSTTPEAPAQAAPSAPEPAAPSTGQPVGAPEPVAPSTGQPAVPPAPAQPAPPTIGVAPGLELPPGAIDGSEVTVGDPPRDGDLNRLRSVGRSSGGGSRPTSSRGGDRLSGLGRALGARSGAGDRLAGVRGDGRTSTVADRSALRDSDRTRYPDTGASTWLLALAGLSCVLGGLILRVRPLLRRSRPSA